MPPSAQAAEPGGDRVWPPLYADETGGRRGRGGLCMKLTEVPSMRSAQATTSPLQTELEAWFSWGWSSQANRGRWAGGPAGGLLSCCRPALLSDVGGELRASQESPRGESWSAEVFWLFILCSPAFPTVELNAEESTQHLHSEAEGKHLGFSELELQPPGLACRREVGTGQSGSLAPGPLWPPDHP